MRTVVLVLILLVAALLPAAPALGTHPGVNGPIVLTSTDSSGITTVGLDGTITEVTTQGPIQLEVSPDGRTVLHSGLGNVGDIAIQSLAGGPIQPLVPRDVGGRPDVTWSPDGTRFAVAIGGQITVYDADGSNPQVVFDAQVQGFSGPEAIVWTILNEIIGVERFQARGMRVNMNDGAITRLDGSDGAYSPDTQYGIDSSPDGQMLTISCTERTGEQLRGVCIWARDFGVIRFIPPTATGQFLIQKPAWSPDGTRLAFVGTNFETEFAAVYTSTVEGTDVQLLAELPADPRVQGNNPTIASWAVAPATPPEPLEEPPPPPTNNALAMGGFDGNATTTERADYTDHTAYAVAVSRARFVTGAAAHGVVSRDDAFPDSLAGAALTGEGPLLFTASDALPSSTFDELVRAVGGGGTVYLLGGTAAISQAVEDQLAETFMVTRLAGPSRVETSIAVATEVLNLYGAPDTSFAGARGGTVAIARAGGPANNPTAGWADSVTAGAWTAANRIPTFVTDTSGVHPALADLLEGLQPDRTVLLGGTGALSQAVEDAVPNPDRIAGLSRADTARAIAQDLIGGPEDGSREAVAINGFRDDGWLFGLPAAGLAADTNGSIALVTDPLPPESGEQLCDPDDIDVLLAGGFGIITEATADAIDAAPACG
ncbi:MAG: cell wall-binding repeat-containing protein [Euzebya sp.]